MFDAGHRRLKVAWVWKKKPGKCKSKEGRPLYLGQMIRGVSVKTLEKRKKGKSTFD